MEEKEGKGPKQRKKKKILIFSCALKRTKLNSVNKDVVATAYCYGILVKRVIYQDIEDTQDARVSMHYM
jgi:hypothetical protein